MKLFSLSFLIVAASASLSLRAAELERFSPHFSGNAEITWNASTNQLPSRLWIYRRHGPRVFPATVISNAIVLASLQSKGIPKPSRKDFFIWEDRGRNYPGGVPAIFSILPKHATISHYKARADWGSGKDLPNDATVLSNAWSKLACFGVDPSQVKLKTLTSKFCEYNEMGKDVGQHLCGRGVFLSRQLDGLSFFGKGDDDNNEGFWIEFGSHGQIRGFSLNWPVLERYKSEQTATPKQIMECIRNQRVCVLPEENESPGYFERIKLLGTAQKLTVTKLTPRYVEGVLGKTPTDDSPAELITLIAELEIVASLGNQKVNAVMVAPVLATDANRLLKEK